MLRSNTIAHKTTGQNIPAVSKPTSTRGALDGGQATLPLHGVPPAACWAVAIRPRPESVEPRGGAHAAPLLVVCSRFGDCEAPLGRRRAPERVGRGGVRPSREYG